jgi:hypothetical protein
MEASDWVPWLNPRACGRDSRGEKALERRHGVRVMKNRMRVVALERAYGVSGG